MRAWPCCGLVSGAWRSEPVALQTDRGSQTAKVEPRRILVGYSLGAILAGMLAPQVEATHIVAVSPPVARVSLEAYRSYAGPKLFIAGDADFAFDLERFETEYDALPDPKRFARMSGADHFFRKEEERVQRALAEWILEEEGGHPG